MQEIAAPSLIAEAQVGLSHGTLCLRFKGSGLISAVLEGATLVLIVAGSGGPRHPDRPFLDEGVGTIIEAAVPFEAIGVNGGVRV